MISRWLARTLGALALAAALATSSTAAFAATPTSDPAFYVTKRKVTTLAGLSPELRTSAIEKAQTLKGEVGTSRKSDAELSATCDGDWFITWDENANGDPIMGTFTLHCDGEAIPIG